MNKEQSEAIFSKMGISNPLKYKPDQLKKLYLALIKKNHPDVGGDVHVMQEINAAYDVLSKISYGLHAFGFRK